MTPSQPSCLRETVMASRESREMSFLAAGSAMYTRRVSVCTEQAFLDVVKLIRSCDVSFMNMEGLIGHPDAYPLKPYSFASYFSGEPWLAEEYKWTGFNLTSLANNHSTDWSPEAIYETTRRLDDAGIVHAGAGKNLTAAREPGYLDTKNGRVALISIDSSMEQGEFARPTMASDARGAVLGRPGVNAIRYEVYIETDKETFESLKRIRSQLKMDVFRGREKDTEAEIFFSNAGNPGLKFRLGDRPGFHTEADPKDVEANLRWVRNAKAMADYVLVTHHTHANGNHETGPYVEVPAEFVQKLAHDCIEAGADAFLGHGYHGKGIEIYQGKPIFYDLGWFAWMVETLPRYPSDLYEEWGLGADALPVDIVNARPAGGFGTSSLWNEGLLYEFTLDAGRVTALKLHPVTMGRELPPWERGLPRRASGSAAEKIFKRYQEMSEAFGTRMDYENGVGVVRVPE